jgi:hypothetical protein
MATRLLSGVLTVHVTVLGHGRWRRVEQRRAWLASATSPRSRPSFQFSDAFADNRPVRKHLGDLAPNYPVAPFAEIDASLLQCFKPDFHSIQLGMPSGKKFLRWSAAFCLNGQSMVLNMNALVPRRAALTWRYQIKNLAGTVIVRSVNEGCTPFYPTSRPPNARPLLRPAGLLPSNSRIFTLTGALV